LASFSAVAVFPAAATLIGVCDILAVRETGRIDENLVTHVELC
jgi:hypothetical protein